MTTKRIFISTVAAALAERPEWTLVSRVSRVEGQKKVCVIHLLYYTSWRKQLSKTPKTIVPLRNEPPEWNEEANANLKILGYSAPYLAGIIDSWDNCIISSREDRIPNPQEYMLGYKDGTLLREHFKPEVLKYPDEVL